MYSELPYAKYTNLPYPGERDQFKIDSWSPQKKNLPAHYFMIHQFQWDHLTRLAVTNGIPDEPVITPN